MFKKMDAMLIIPLVVILKCRTNWQNPLTTLSWKDTVSQYSEVLSEAGSHTLGPYERRLLAFLSGIDKTCDDFVELAKTST